MQHSLFKQSLSLATSVLMLSYLFLVTAPASGQPYQQQTSVTADSQQVIISSAEGTSTIELLSHTEGTYTETYEARFTDTQGRVLDFTATIGNGETNITFMNASRTATVDTDFDDSHKRFIVNTLSHDANSVHFDQQLLQAIASADGLACGPYEDVELDPLRTVANDFGTSQLGEQIKELATALDRAVFHGVHEQVGVWAWIGCVTSIVGYVGSFGALIACGTVVGCLVGLGFNRVAAIGVVASCGPLLK